MNPTAQADTPVRDWHATLAKGSFAGPPTNDARIRRFRDIGGEIVQPALQDHVLAIHLGGAKRVTRYSGIHMNVFDIPDRAMTIMPAHESRRWRTQGPIDFVHLTLDDEQMRRTALEEYDADPDHAVLQGAVGLTDPLLVALARSLLAEAERPEPSRLYCDSLLSALQCHLLLHHSPLAARRTPSPAAARTVGGLAGWQLRRVLDFMQARLGEEINLADLVDLTGLSRSQFFHAFSRSVGRTPHAYLTDLRVARAQVMLRDTDLPVSRLAAAVGLTQPQLSAAFRRRVGTTPTAYRREFGSGPALQTDSDHG